MSESAARFADSVRSRKRGEVVTGLALAAGVIGAVVGGLGPAQFPVGVAVGAFAVGLWFFTWRPGLLLAIGVFVCVQPLIVNNLRYFAPELARPVRLIDEFCILVLVLMVATEVLLRGRSTLGSRLYGLFGSIVIIGLIASLLNRVPPQIAAFDLFLMFKVFLIFVIAAHLRLTAAQLLWFWKSMTYWGIALLIIGILDVVSYPWLGELLRNTSFSDTRWGFPNAKSLFIHPGAFGFFMATMTLMNVGLYAATRQRKYAQLAALFATGVVLSGRLKPLVGVPITIMVVGFITKRITLRQTMLAVFPLILFLAVFWPQVVERGRGKLSLGRFRDLQEAAPRAVLYLTSARIALDEFPFGAGLGRFGGEISRRYYSPVYRQYGISGLSGFGPRGDEEAISFIQDAGWAYYLGELGILGLIGVLAALAYILRELLRIASRARSQYLRGLALGAALVLIEAMLESVASPVLQSSFQGYFALAFAGAVCSRWQSEQHDLSSRALKQA